MNLAKYFISLTLSLAISYIAIGQINLSSSIKTETPSEYYLQVKQFNEFIDRFNFVSDWKGNLIDDDFAKKYPRKSYIGYLFNLNDSRLNNKVDSSYNELCANFINDAVDKDSPLKISLYGGQVTAKTQVSIKYMGKSHVATIHYTAEVLHDRSAKWVISKVETNCFKTLNDSLKTYFISPNSHETSFINIKRLDNLSNPIYYLPTELATDTKLQFVTEVSAGRLEINNIEKVSYIITFPQWKITVEEFVRTDYNSGWLISDIVKL